MSFSCYLQFQLLSGEKMVVFPRLSQICMVLYNLWFIMILKEFPFLRKRSCPDFSPSFAPISIISSSVCRRKFLATASTSAWSVPCRVHIHEMWLAAHRTFWTARSWMVSIGGSYLNTRTQCKRYDMKYMVQVITK